MPEGPPITPSAAWRCVLRVVVVALLLAVPRRGAAQDASGARMPADGAAVPAPDDARREKAERQFERGLALASRFHDWEGALAEFLESRRLYPTRSATRNAAIALRQLGRYADSLELYDALLGEFGDSIPGDQRGALLAERQAVLDRLGQLVIQTSESGVSIVLDGSQRGVSPLPMPLGVEPGSHTLRLVKDGFESVDLQVLVTAGARRNVNVAMKRLTGAGSLVVREASGEPLDVVIDAAIVGRAPWRGNVSAGRHSVLLRGERRGTTPISVVVRVQQTAELLLRSRVLDADAVIEPEPPTSTIFIDGVFAANGAWSGALPSGAHRFEAVAPGYLPFRQDLRLEGGHRTVVHARLAASGPSRPALTKLYLEPAAGLLFARTLRGGIDATCDCDDRSRPFGWIASGRVGYALYGQSGPELSGGYLSISESAMRTVRASGEPGVSDFVSSDSRDSVTLSGAFLALGASVRFLRRTPVTARFAAGAALLRASFSNSGTFVGATDGVPPGSISGTLSIEEPARRLVVPFTSTELRVGYRLSARVTVDIGVSAMLFLPPGATRSHRSGLLDDADRLRVGVLTLPDEAVARPFIAVSPSVAARFEL